MRRALSFLCIAALLFSPACFAQDNTEYKNMIDLMIIEIDKLTDSLRAATPEYGTYVKWYENYSAMNEQFRKTFTQTNKQRKSYQSVWDAMNQLASARSMLYRAQDADNQYTESITANDVSYAHKWKSTALVEKTNAAGAIAKAAEALKQAKDLLSSEN